MTVAVCVCACDTAVCCRSHVRDVTVVPQVETDVEMDALEYNMRHQQRGLCVVFEHQQFKYEEERVGSDKDVARIAVTFRRLGFTVELHRDLEMIDLMTELRRLAERDSHRHSDCLVVFCLTHGKPGKLCAMDMSYPANKLWEEFTADRCPELAGKPKLFFVAACRGKRRERGVRFTWKTGRTRADSAVRSNGGYLMPAHADILLAHSSADGFYSFREEDAGTWWVQVVCEVFEERAAEWEVTRMLTEVARRVASDRNTQSDLPEEHGLLQQPCFTSMLVRQLYLRPPADVGMDTDVDRLQHQL